MPYGMTLPGLVCFSSSQGYKMVSLCLSLLVAQRSLYLSLPLMANNDALVNMPKINYILIAVGSACMVVTIYHCITACCCSRREAINRPPDADPQTTTNPSHALCLVDEMIPGRLYEKGEEFIGEEGTCSVCLSEFEDGDRLRTLPECMHTFHAQCIDTWLCSHSSCPICRAEASPAPFMCRNAPGFHSSEYGMLQDSGIPQSVVVQSARM